MLERDAQFVATIIGIPCAIYLAEFAENRTQEHDKTKS